MIYKIAIYFIIFLIYATVGYIYEVIAMSIINKKLSLSRGYLIGPYLPVYGLGCLMITLFITKYASDRITVFLLGMIYCCTLEYLTSYILEKIYGLRWWDYSDKKYNLNGRINLVTGIKFGISSIFIIEVFNPLIYKILGIIPESILVIISIFLASIIILDTIISSYTIAKLKINTKKYYKKDATEEIKEKVIQSLKKYRGFYIRLFHAFPNITIKYPKFNNIKNNLKKIEQKRKKKWNKKRVLH